MFQRVIVPLDGSAWSETALETGAEVAERFGARLTLLHAYKGEERSLRDVVRVQSLADAGIAVDPHLYDTVTEAAQAERADSSAYLERLAQTQRARGLVVESLLIDASASDALLQEVGRNAGTLVVMCSHGRSGLERLILGNTAETLLSKSHVPVLLLRHPEESNKNGGRTTEGVAMATDIRIGAEVMGVGGKLGEVHRVIVDALTGNITDLVVKHGFVFGNERVVPLSHVSRVESGVIYLDLDQQHFEIMNGFADDRYHSPDPSYVGPPGFANTGFLLNEMVAGGGAAGPAAGSPPFGFPGGEQTSPDDMQRPVVQAGTPVVDVNGEKIGEVSQINLSAPDGKPTRITLRQGHIFHHETDLPLDWVDELSDKGVTLKVAKSQVEALNKEEKRP